MLNSKRCQYLKGNKVLYISFETFSLLIRIKLVESFGGYIGDAKAKKKRNNLIH